MSGSPGRCFCRRWNLDDASIAASREAFTSDCTNDLLVDVTTFELPHSRHWPPAAWVSIGQMKRLPGNRLPWLLRIQVEAIMAN